MRRRASLCLHLPIHWAPLKQPCHYCFRQFSRALQRSQRAVKKANTTSRAMKRDTSDPISPCADTCFFAAAAAVAGCGNPSPDINCVCTNADFQFKWISCVQAECQAAELDKVDQWLAEECGAQSLSITGKPTATTPFLPSNSNADIGTTKVQTTTNPRSTEISSSGGTSIATVRTSDTPAQSTDPRPTEISSSGKIPTATSGTSDTPAQSTSYQNSSPTASPTSSPNAVPTGSPTAVPLQIAHRNRARTAAIAASVVCVVLVVAVVISLFQVRRSRRRIRERRVPEQFIESREHIVPEPSTMKVGASASAESAEAEVDQPRLVGAAASNEAQLKHGATANLSAGTANLQPLVASAEGVAPLSDSEQATRDEETVTLRLRRLEAQVETFLSLGLPEGSPPRYSR
ncbi:CFEM domain-containing protein [Mycena venus]|uniref:CFEM domain-containing protein n=1 Tax=Mycena venus TaxID=2733690 RepID=A0A8H6YS07_9AGAR|nr:CFEM domain-containing protein [Mycena venus]